jgi:UDP-N-acetylglucosamine diphosphorylase / glucose-1-phosphate thymidylyltransferase / UDP-N-acetylgalactosamine diphosphorylase / glucosamine-1-phosphate N-acetyltransferase / galactosamine-1-phosphate N-acetyltransferase
MRIVVFEDEGVNRLVPMSLARPAYAISCGAARLADWLALLPGPRQGIVRSHLEELQRIDFPHLHEGPPQADEPLLLVNARLIPSVDAFRTLQTLLKSPAPGVVRHQQDVVAARLPAGLWPAGAEDFEQFQMFLQSPALAQAPPLEHALPLLGYPHEVIHASTQIIRSNLEYRLAHGTYREVADGVFLADGAKLGDCVSTNTRDGPIVLEENVSVGPFCYLSGPGHVGKNARLIEHAAIKDAVSIGHTVKIGGEVEASIIEPYTNKQHYGFLGHSYLGSWINLGAGTCNSDLKNTYGTINMDYPFGRVATGRQFVGCIMGDYAKSAINTGIFTGKIIGVCSMLYGFVTTNVPSFVNYARLFGQVTELPPDVMIATQQRMFQRRNVAQRPCDIQLLNDMYLLTRDERQTTGDHLSL